MFISAALSAKSQLSCDYFVGAPSSFLILSSYSEDEQYSTGDFLISLISYNFSLDFSSMNMSSSPCSSGVDMSINVFKI